MLSPGANPAQGACVFTLEFWVPWRKQTAVNDPDNSFNAPSPPPQLPVCQPQRTRHIRWWIHLLLLGSFPVIVGVLGSSRPTVHAPALTHSPRGLVIMCLLQLAVFGVIFGLAWLASRPTKADLLWHWRPGVWAIPLGIAYSVVLRLVLGLLAVLVLVALVLTHYVRLEDLQQFVRDNRPDVGAIVDISALRHNPLYFWLTLTLVSFVVAGFREELWRAAFLAGLRALWPAAFGSTLGQLAGVAMAAVVFGLGHLAQGPLAVILTGLLGMGLGTIMVLHRSLWPAVIAHGMFDATTFAILPLA